MIAVGGNNFVIVDRLHEAAVFTQPYRIVAHFREVDFEHISVDIHSARADRIFIIELEEFESDCNVIILRMESFGNLTLFVEEFDGSYLPMAVDIAVVRPTAATPRAEEQEHQHNRKKEEPERPETIMICRFHYSLIRDYFFFLGANSHPVLEIEIAAP